MIRRIFSIMAAAALIRRRERAMLALHELGMLRSYHMRITDTGIREVAHVRIPGATLCMTGAGACGLARMERRMRR